MGSGSRAPVVTRRSSLPAWSGETQHGACGSGVASKMSDNEDSTAFCGRSEVGPVDHPVGPPIPEFFQAHDDRCHVSALSGDEKSRRVLEENPSGAEAGDQAECVSDEAVELVEQA